MYYFKQVEFKFILKIILGVKKNLKKTTWKVKIEKSTKLI